MRNIYQAMTLSPSAPSSVSSVSSVVQLLQFAVALDRC
jgi:hypothetical protein